MIKNCTEQTHVKQVINFDDQIDQEPEHPNTYHLKFNTIRKINSEDEENASFEEHIDKGELWKIEENSLIKTCDKNEMIHSLCKIVSDQDREICETKKEIIQLREIEFGFLNSKIRTLQDISIAHCDDFEMLNTYIDLNREAIDEIRLKDLPTNLKQYAISYYLDENDYPSYKLGEKSYKFETLKETLDTFSECLSSLSRGLCTFCGRIDCQIYTMNKDIEKIKKELEESTKK